VGDQAAGATRNRPSVPGKSTPEMDGIIGAGFFPKIRPVPAQRVDSLLDGHSSLGFYQSRIAQIELAYFVVGVDPKLDVSVRR